MSRTERETSQALGCFMLVGTPVLFLLEFLWEERRFFPETTNAGWALIPDEVSLLILLAYFACCVRFIWNLVSDEKDRLDRAFKAGGVGFILFSFTAWLVAASLGFLIGLLSMPFR